MIIRLLIDGYNLLHATGAIAQGRGPGRLAHARQRMLGQIAAELTDEERQTTQVVFDTKRSVEDDNVATVRGMTVTYAVGFAEADDLLEQLIRQHPQPRLLTVVSSDLRVQRCAKARKAQALGSDQWLMQLLDRPLRKTTHVENQETEATELRIQEPAGAGPKREQLLSNDEVQAWLKEFGLDHAP
jgi:uncharacterized protein